MNEMTKRRKESGKKVQFLIRKIGKDSQFLKTCEYKKVIVGGSSAVIRSTHISWTYVLNLEILDEEHNM